MQVCQFTDFLEFSYFFLIVEVTVRNAKKIAENPRNVVIFFSHRWSSKMMMMVIHLSGWKITRCILFMHLASLCRISIICSMREVLCLPVSNNKSKNRKNEVYGSVIENEWESFGIYFFAMEKKQDQDGPDYKVVLLAHLTKPLCNFITDMFTSLSFSSLRYVLRV